MGKCLQWQQIQDAYNNIYQIISSYPKICRLKQLKPPCLFSWAWLIMVFWVFPKFLAHRQRRIFRRQGAVHVQVLARPLPWAHGMPAKMNTKMVIKHQMEGFVWEYQQKMEYLQMELLFFENINYIWWIFHFHVWLPEGSKMMTMNVTR